MNRSTLIAFGLALAAVLAAIVLLVTGGGDAMSSEDPVGDVTVSDGSKAPRELSLADMTRATVERESSEIVFEVQMESEIPRRLPKQALGWRWEIYEGGQTTWLVSANVDLGPNASVLSTQTDYQASTVDDLLPGSIEVDGSTLRVRISPDEIEGFPTAFEWLVKTSLDGDRVASRSAVAEDQAPDGGYQRLDE